MIIQLALLVISFGLFFGCASEKDGELVIAAGTGNTELVRSLIEQGANIEAHAVDDWTPLTAASRGGHVEVVKILLKSHANINAVEGGGNTALFWAVFNGHTEVVKVLLQHGADTAKKAENGRLPVDVASEKKYDEIFLLLQRKNTGIKGQVTFQ